MGIKSPGDDTSYFLFFSPPPSAQCALQNQAQENAGRIILHLELARLDDPARNNEKWYVKSFAEDEKPEGTMNALKSAAWSPDWMRLIFMAAI